MKAPEANPKKQAGRQLQTMLHCGKSIILRKDLQKRRKF